MGNLPRLLHRGGQKTMSLWPNKDNVGRQRLTSVSYQLSYRGERHRRSLVGGSRHVKATPFMVAGNCNHHIDHRHWIVKVMSRRTICRVSPQSRPRPALESHRPRRPTSRGPSPTVDNQPHLVPFARMLASQGAFTLAWNYASLSTKVLMTLARGGQTLAWLRTCYDTRCAMIVCR